MDYQFTYTFAVRDYELDIQGIVNNAEYLHYLELTRHAFCDYVGVSFGEMTERGLAPVVRHADMEFISSLTSGDEVLSCLNISRKGPRFFFHQDLYRLHDKQQVLKAVITVVVLEDGKLSRGDQMAEFFSAYLS
ncbi:MAG: acyl-CoA thioesterase [Muribaculaceae bacterium]|nr:acyl-CoA thioesterase [Muribaculaceae bacterium]